MEVKKKALAPVYGVAVVWVLYCLIFPLYKTWHFIVLACVAALSYFALSAIFPGKTEFVERPKEPAQPERTGDDKIDVLLAEGEKAVLEMRRLRDSIPDNGIKGKIDDISAVTDKIFKDLVDDPDDYSQVKRFADFHLPATIKLLHAYDRFGSSGAGGENITGTLERIDAALDKIQDSYERFFDSLFMNQALDIETDIRVLESFMKKEGLVDKDF